MGERGPEGEPGVPVSSWLLQEVIIVLMGVIWQVMVVYL